VPPAAVSGHMSIDNTIAYPSAEALLVTHVGTEAFVTALNDSGLHLGVMKREPQTIEAALSHAIKLEAYEQSLSLRSVTIYYDDSHVTRQPCTCLCSYRSVGCG